MVQLGTDLPLLIIMSVIALVWVATFKTEISLKNGQQALKAGLQANLEKSYTSSSYTRRLQWL